MLCEDPGREAAPGDGPVHWSGDVQMRMRTRAETGIVPLARGEIGTQRFSRVRHARPQTRRRSLLLADFPFGFVAGQAGPCADA